MRRLLFFGALAGLIYGARCWWREQHAPVRTMLGLRCEDCGQPLADFDEAYGSGNGWVHCTRTTYDRTHGSVTRTTHWEPSDRGQH